jgi:hypothetical protein
VPRLEFVTFNLNKNNASCDLTAELANKGDMMKFLSSLLKTKAKATRLLHNLKQGKMRGSLVCRIEIKSTQSCWQSSLGGKKPTGTMETRPMQLTLKALKKTKSDVVVGGVNVDDETLVFTGITSGVCPPLIETRFT